MLQELNLFTKNLMILRLWFKETFHETLRMYRERGMFHPYVRFFLYEGSEEEKREEG
jgi:hypothetical protein